MKCTRATFILIALSALALVVFAAAPQKPAPASPADKSTEARLNNLGAAYMNQQLFEKALKSFEAAAALDPKQQIPQLNRGIALLNLQRLDQAKQLLVETIKRDPKDPHAWYNLGLLYKNTSDTQAAADAFRHVTEIDPNDADSWYFLGSVYAQAKQYPQAIEAFQHALKLNPLHASAEFGLSRAYQQSGNMAQARQHLTRFQYITQNKLGSPVSLAYGEQGKYSLAEESQAATVKVPPQIPVKVVDVTERAGLVTKADRGPREDLASYLGPGACFLDYDNDGKIDIFLPDDGTEGGMSLYHNLGNGKFEDVTKRAGLDLASRGIGCAAGDYDNDGIADLAVTMNGRVLLLHNEKNGTFKDVTQTAGIKSDGLNVSVTWVDYDHDGDLDLYVTQSPNDPPGRLCGGPGPIWCQTSLTLTSTRHGTNSMWRNNGNGTFTEVSSSIGLQGSATSFAAVGTDWNNDRAVDIIVTNAVGIPTVFENPREGKFTQREAFSVSTASTGMAVLDFDHDGWMDVVLAHTGSAPITLWHNNHGKSFERVDIPQTDLFKAFGVAAFDYDNDGWIDIAFVGQVRDGRGEVRLFRNLGQDGFKDVTADVGLDKIQLKDPRAI
ncbi:MAG: hypothetical protein DMG72_17430, partial [Acidobacteria bacterium]